MHIVDILKFKVPELVLSTVSLTLYIPQMVTIQAVHVDLISMCICKLSKEGTSKLD